MNESEIAKWLINGVNVHDFVRHFKGRAYVSDVPPKQHCFSNSKMYLLILFVKNNLSNSQQDVLIKLFGKVYACLPPRVMRSQVMIM